MSDTPRTDAESFHSSMAQNITCVRAEFARQLERELSEVKAKLGEAEKERDAIRKAFEESSTDAENELRAKLAASEARGKGMEQDAKRWDVIRNHARFSTRYRNDQQGYERYTWLDSPKEMDKYVDAVLAPADKEGKS